jgi:hypothetical protein
LRWWMRWCEVVEFEVVEFEVVEGGGGVEVTHH